LGTSFDVFLQPSVTFPYFLPILPYFEELRESYFIGDDLNEKRRYELKKVAGHAFFQLNFVVVLVYCLW